ncbi:LLM class flavin-dependent oxidoreductase [Actinoplanes sp. NPDC049802]|uniref:LLM class flavin-dependent oxidoreductase n=1 Tax=Actinoplanes sp. NPDC049802 TaxID=3154742 RepID=UPI0033FEA59B
MWLLGSGTTAAEIAARQLLGYCYGHFLNPDGSRTSLDMFRSAAAGAPRMLAVRVFVAATVSAAEAQAADYLLWRSRKDLGADEPLPPAGEADRHHWTAAERTRATRNSRAIVVGDPRQVRETITTMAAIHDVDEVMINMLLPEIGERVSAYRLLADAFNLRQ